MMIVCEKDSEEVYRVWCSNATYKHRLTSQVSSLYPVCIHRLVQRMKEYTKVSPQRSQTKIVNNSEFEGGRSDSQVSTVELLNSSESARQDLKR